MRPNTSDDFWPHIERQPDGCWIWRGPPHTKGYGRFYWRGRRLLAHRAAWILTAGEVPDGLCVLHHCDNPPCCNPAHLFLGTRQDNNADKLAKGRQRKGDWIAPERRARGERHGSRTHPEALPRGERKPGAKLREADIPVIARRAAGGISFRQIGRQFGIHHDTVAKIVRGEKWKHVQRPTLLDGAGKGSFPAER